MSTRLYDAGKCPTTVPTVPPSQIGSSRYSAVQREDSGVPFLSSFSRNVCVYPREFARARGGSFIVPIRAL